MTAVFVLIDGNAILHRAYHALPPLTSRSGKLLNAVYGFSNMLLRVISDLKPQYLAVAFDTPIPTFRQKEYLGYQAKRPEMEEGLKGQIEEVHEVVYALGIPVFQKEGFEADDVIGTLARQASLAKGHKEEVEVVIVTGDRDLLQLVGPNIRVYAPEKGFSECLIFDEKKVEEKMGVKPAQIVDLKSLTGDASDNYPGVPGIGPKTAVFLLKEYGSLEGIYTHLDEIREKIGSRVADMLIGGRELAKVSRKLATIVTNVPLKFNLKKCYFEFDAKRRKKAVEKFRELGFRSLVGRLKSPEKNGKALVREKREQLRLI